MTIAKPTLTFGPHEPEVFHFAIDGEALELPSVHTNLSFGAKLKAQTARNAQEQLTAFLEYEADEKTMAAVRTLRGQQVDDFAAEWMKFEAADLGE